MTTETWLGTVAKHRCSKRGCYGRTFLAVKEALPYDRKRRRIGLVCAKCTEGYVGYPAPR